MTQTSGDEQTVQHLREMAAARVESTSLRGVAREIRMSPTGLKKFLMGTAPYSPTLRRLRKWAVRYAANVTLASDQVGRTTAHAAVAVLTEGFLPSARGAAADAIFSAVARGFDASGLARPQWVGELREAFADAERFESMMVTLERR